MNREKSQENGAEEEKLAENLQFMRLVIEKTRREIDPEAFSMIIWGLVCMVIYFGVYFLAIHEMFNWMPYVLFPSLAVGGIVGGISSYKGVQTSEGPGNGFPHMETAKLGLANPATQCGAMEHSGII